MLAGGLPKHQDEGVQVGAQEILQCPISVAGEKALPDMLPIALCSPRWKLIQFGATSCNKFQEMLRAGTV